MAKGIERSFQDTIHITAETKDEEIIQKAISAYNQTIYRVMEKYSHLGKTDLTFEDEKIEQDHFLIMATPNIRNGLFRRTIWLNGYVLNQNNGMKVLTFKEVYHETKSLRSILGIKS